MDKIGFQDDAYLQGLDNGFDLTGLIPASGHGLPMHNQTGPVKSVDTLLAEAKRRRQEGKVPTASKYIKQLWENINKEQRKGWWSPWQRMKDVRGDYASHLYFGKDEGDKIRGILAPDNDTGLRRFDLVYIVAVADAATHLWG